MRSIKNNGLYKVIRHDIKSYDGRIIMCKGEYCGGNDRCYGLFELNNKEQPIIKVAIGTKSPEQWFGILVHEYCHFLQWKEQSELWTDFEDCSFNIDEIIKNPKKYKKQLLLLIRLEADCERRAIKLIKNYHIPFDIDSYVKEANCILYKYAMLYTNSFWPKNTQEVKNSHELCPNKIHKSYLKYLEIPEDLYDIYINSQP
jgi:hypothetical protein